MVYCPARPAGIGRLVGLVDAGRSGRVAGAERQQRRIAVVGASGYDHVSDAAKVECFPWARLRKVKNLADYDVLILDLPSLSDPGVIDAEDFGRVLDTTTAGRILGSGEGAIYVLGDPRFDLRYETSEGRVTKPFLSWTGLEFDWDDRGGVAVKKGPLGHEGPFATLADGLRRYDYSMIDCQVIQDPEAWHWGIWDMGAFNGAGTEAVCEVSDICTTRYGLSVAFVAYHAIVPSQPPVRRQVGRRTYLAEGGPPTAVSGPMVFLPKSRLSQKEVIGPILRDVLGVEISAPEPEWIGAFAAPGQAEVDGAIAKVQDDIAALTERRGDLLRKREEVRRPLALLYQTGDALEEAVWSAMEALGAEVVRRPEKGRNAADGRATVRLGNDTLEFVLETKGETGKHFGFESLRQLADWISDAIDRGDAPPKALMVGNGSRKRPPKLREWPFNHNFASNARKRGHAAIRSEDLYVAYVLDRRGALDREGFWKMLHAAHGPVDMGAYREKLAPEEADQLGAPAEG